VSERTAEITLARPRRFGAQLVPRLLGWLAAAALLLLLPRFFASSFALSMLSQMGIAVIFALSYNMLLGQTGLLSFGHAVFLGLGGFIAMHVMRAMGQGELALPIVVLPLVGALGGLFFGLLFGYLATRRAGTAFAMITLGIAELVAASAFILRGFFGGEEGKSGDRTAGLPFLGFDFGAQKQVYYLIAFWTLAAALAIYALTRTPLGRMAFAVRDNPERVAFIGYDPARIRFLMFAFSGLFAGLAGGLYAINYEILTAFNLGAQASGLVLVMTFVGGVGHFIGPVLGAVLITYLQVNLASYSDAWLLYLGLLFVLMVLFAPQGLAGLLLRHGPLIRAGVAHRLLPVYALAVVPAASLALGAVTLIEINYRLSIKADQGPVMNLLGLAVDASSPLTWAVGIALFVAGLVGLRRAAPLVVARWHALAGAA
jgi:branched-chain amino acid transport system permease protein